MKIEISRETIEGRLLNWSTSIQPNCNMAEKSLDGTEIRRVEGLILTDPVNPSIPKSYQRFSAYIDTNVMDFSVGKILSEGKGVTYNYEANKSSPNPGLPIKVTFVHYKNWSDFAQENNRGSNLKTLIENIEFPKNT